MDNVCLYGDCNAVLKRLLTNPETLSIEELERLSPDYANYVIQEFEDKNIAKWNGAIGCFSDINKDVALALYNKRYYEMLYDSELANRKRDELFERSTVSAEESAKWAKQSTEASTRSAKSAENANIIAAKSDSRSKHANWIAIVSVFVSIIGLLISLLKNIL